MAWTWLDVPYDERNEAEKLGAVWNDQRRRWYAPKPGMETLAKWLPSGEELPSTFAGEDRTWGEGLFVDLIPRTCWFTNVRSCVAQRDWERLRRVIVERADSKCEVCGATRDTDTKRWLEVHERWAYDETTSTQTLKRLICLCTDCHQTTHMGFAQTQGRGEKALKHLMKVTGFDRDDAEEHVQIAFDVWDKRNRMAWSLDLSMLKDAGIEITPPPSADDRSERTSSR
jgi:5-methylcytosine-specific restriction endonuclease McrA